MNRLAYECTFCGNEGVADYDELDPMKLEFWKSILACNRCADFHESRIKVETKIFRTCGSLLALNLRRQEAMTEEGGQLAQTREKLRVALVFLTKQYATLVCRFYNRMEVWEPGFPSMLEDRPDKAGVVLGHYVRDLSSGKLDAVQKL